MKNILIVLSLCFLTTAHALAHLEGTYTGTTKLGEGCMLKVTKTFFANDERSPENERVVVETELTLSSMTVAHPIREGRLLDARQVESDILVATQFIKDGHQHLTITMDHSEEHHGPSSYTLITKKEMHSGNPRIQSCHNLQKQ